MSPRRTILALAHGRQRRMGQAAVPTFATASAPLAAGGPLIQKLDPGHSTPGGTLVALIPIVLLWVLRAVLRMSAWKPVVIGAVVPLILAIPVWGAPPGATFGAW